MSALLHECLFGNCTLGETDKLVKINHGYNQPPNCYLALNQARKSMLQEPRQKVVEVGALRIVSRIVERLSL
jgi:hypothetical protein